MQLISVLITKVKLKNYAIIRLLINTSRGLSNRRYMTECSFFFLFIHKFLVIMHP